MLTASAKGLGEKDLRSAASAEFFDDFLANFESFALSYRFFLAFVDASLPFLTEQANADSASLAGVAFEQLSISQAGVSTTDKPGPSHNCDQVGLL